jgi:hypothetical protein
MPWWDGEYSDKTDVFSLGVLLWELFSGKSTCPVAASMLRSTTRKHREPGWSAGRL